MTNIDRAEAILTARHRKDQMEGDGAVGCFDAAAAVEELRDAGLLAPGPQIIHTRDELATLDPAAVALRDAAADLSAGLELMRPERTPDPAAAVALRACARRTVTAILAPAAWLAGLTPPPPDTRVHHLLAYLAAHSPALSRTGAIEAPDVRDLRHLLVQLRALTSDTEEGEEW